MNDRIKLFAEQADEFADDKTQMPGEYHPDWHDIRDRKFAELIVRECVKVMYDNAIERRVPPDINQTPTHYAIAVLEHFGVEE